MRILIGIISVISIIITFLFVVCVVFGFTPTESQTIGAFVLGSIATFTGILLFTEGEF